ncbi:ribonuclease PH [Acidobacteria bacterium Mor1]|nr:ribonuclease PH [Acidobacteria bacterium Mor1]
MSRHDGRTPETLRPVKMTPGYIRHPLGSVLIECGDTRVICNASVEDRVPPFLHHSGEGWVTAEYGMLPASTSSRMQREVSRGKASGRTMEIQRLIGRALRTVVDRRALGERTIWVDCDVIQADGGTRCASITGGFVAMAMAIDKLKQDKRIKSSGKVLRGAVGAVSVGLVEGEPVLDLDYVEDSAADVDMNLVRTDAGEYVELQGTGENTTFSRDHLNELLRLGDLGVDRLIAAQKEALGDAWERLLG